MKNPIDHKLLFCYNIIRAKFDEYHKRDIIHNIIIYGAWLSLVERCVRDAEVAGSNPVAPIFLITVCF